MHAHTCTCCGGRAHRGGAGTPTASMPGADGKAGARAGGGGDAAEEDAYGNAVVVVVVVVYEEPAAVVVV